MTPEGLASIPAKICYLLSEQNRLIKVTTPHEIDRKALLNQLIERVKHQGDHVVGLDLESSTANLVEELDLFLEWLCTQIGQTLKQPTPAPEDWDATFGTKDNCSNYLERQILSGNDAPFVLILTNADRLLCNQNTSQSVFALFRAWIEAGNCHSKWRKFRLILIQSGTVFRLPETKKGDAPFNVGISIEITDLI